MSQYKTSHVIGVPVAQDATPVAKVGENMLQFDIEKKGYNPQQVDDYLAGLQTRYDTLYNENQRKRAIVNALVLYCKAQPQQGEAIMNGVLQYVPPDIPVMERAPHTTPYTQYAADFAHANGLSVSEPTTAKKASKASALGSILYYGMLALMLFLVFLYSQSNAYRNIFGISYYNILTSSMQSTIPRGSFILVRSVEGSELEVGDDITFFMDANTLVTHRIINIYPDYEDSGQYGFQTQGTDNPSPDSNITYEGNVVGKVIFHVPMVGFVLEWASNNVVLVAVGFVLILLLAFFTHMAFFGGDDLEDEEQLPDAADEALLQAQQPTSTPETQPAQAGA